MMDGMTITATGHSYIDVESGTRLEAWYPAEGVNPARSCLAEKVGLIRGEVITTTIDSLDEPVADIADAYLRLHLLSRREAKPNSINLDGIFGFTGLDKFPRMTDYVIPSGVRIADADRVRLGAHLADGTTVMHEGFCNFNAGTLGPAMVEGRISASVVVGANSDVGGGASIMGTLSGGGKERITVGENCLIGANGGIGISLGDNCTVAAGVYVTAGTKVLMPDGSIVAARRLSGRDDMLLLQNSVTGAVELRVSNPERWGGINEDLHAN